MKKMSYITNDRLRYKHLKGADFYQRSALFHYFKTRFSEEEITNTFKRYEVGVSLRYCYNNLFSSAFIYRDIEGKAKEVIDIGFNHITGQILKDGDIVDVRTVESKNIRYYEEPYRDKILATGSSLMKGYNFIYHPTLWGLKQTLYYPKKPVAIVRSEVTALAMAIIDPRYNWLATGLNGHFIKCLNSPNILTALKDKKITLFVKSNQLAMSNSLVAQLKSIGYSISVELLASDDFVHVNMGLK